MNEINVTAISRPSLLRASRETTTFQRDSAEGESQIVQTANHTSAEISLWSGKI